MKYFSIILLLLFNLTHYAQIGINRPEPLQMLDVNGKIKIGDDSLKALQGTIRYNGDFEGLTSQGWSSFTSHGGSLPKQSVPLASWVSNIIPGATATCTFQDWGGNFMNTVPEGKRFIITGIYPSSLATSLNNNFYILSLLVYENDWSLPFSRIQINRYDNDVRNISGDQSPLIVLNPGQELRVLSSNASQIDMNIAIRGFMIDESFYQN